MFKKGKMFGKVLLQDLGQWRLSDPLTQSLVVTFPKKTGQLPRHLGPVVQSIVSLTSSLRGQVVKCFTTL